MSELRLTIGSNVYTGWKTVNIHQSIDQLAGTFQVSTTEGLVGRRALTTDGTLWQFTQKIYNGDLCKIEIGPTDSPTTIITGYIDDIDNSYDHKTHNITLRGRDVMCDLVDCSFYPRDMKYEEQNEWTEENAETIITDICAPFNILVETEEAALTPATEPIVKFKVNDGETAAESIRRVSRAKGILAISKGNGKLYLTQAGDVIEVGSIALGRNVKKGALRQSNKDRFSHYIVKGKGKSESTQLFGREINIGKVISDEIIQSGNGYYSDPGKPTQRFRPRVILADMITNFMINPVLAKIRKDTRKGSEVRQAAAVVDLAAQRGEQEARIRAGNSRQLQYTVQGWVRNALKEPWAINTLTLVKDDLLGIDGAFLIKDVRFRLDPTRGSETDLVLVHKEAYKVIQKSIKDIKSDNDLLFSEQFLAEHFNIVF